MDRARHKVSEKSMVILRFLVSDVREWRHSWKNRIINQNERRDTVYLHTYGVYGNDDKNQKEKFCRQLKTWPLYTDVKEIRARDINWRAIKSSEWKSLLKPYIIKFTNNDNDS